MSPVATAAPSLPPFPPSYSQTVSLPEGQRSTTPRQDPLDLLPEYSSSSRAQPVPKEFHYEMKKKVTLIIIAESTLSKNMPTFVEGAPIEGRVKLSLDKPDSIQSITISILGQVIIGANQGEQLTFIDVHRTLWSQSDGEPQNISIDSGHSGPVQSSGSNPTDDGTASRQPKFSGKLQGDYVWQFSIELPKEVVVTFGGKGEPQVFTLPQTFSERHTRASVRYEVWLRLNRGKLRPDYRLNANIGFIPVTRPPPFLPLRRLAYQEGSALSGPDIDPEGWHATAPVQILGTVLGQRTVQIKCSLYLAKPLAYTRGSSIPLSIRLESPDEQALDMLSSSKTIVLRLRRRIKIHHNPDKAFDLSAWKDAIDHSQLAIWWPSVEGTELPRVRYVNGELHLKSDMKPTSAIAHFRIDYSVVLFPFDTPGVSLPDTDQLIEQSVDIVTAFAPGPQPRLYAPPGYEDTSITSQIFVSPNGFL